MTPRQPRTAFTLVELLVVVAIIVILLGAVITVGGKVIANAKANDTKAMFQTLALAIEQFKDDAPLAKVKGYPERYRNYPPDELDVFADPATTALPRVRPMVNPTTPRARLEDGSHNPLTEPLNDVQHRDTKAMALAITQFSPEAAAILDKVDDRFKKTGQTLTGQAEYYDTNHAGADNSFLQPLIYFVDSWGTPIEYYAANLLAPSSSEIARTDSASGGYPPPNGRRLEASTAMVTANNGQPVFVSYGPDGSDQFAQDYLDTVGQTQLVWDFNRNYDTGAIDRAISHRLNHDNIYSNDELADKLAVELPK